MLAAHWRGHFHPVNRFLHIPQQYSLIVPTYKKSISPGTSVVTLLPTWCQKPSIVMWELDGIYTTKVTTKILSIETLGHSHSIQNQSILQVVSCIFFSLGQLVNYININTVASRHRIFYFLKAFELIPMRNHFTFWFTP